MVAWYSNVALRISSLLSIDFLYLFPHFLPNINVDPVIYS